MAFLFLLAFCLSPFLLIMYFLKSQPFVISASATKESKAASFSLANIELINPEKEHKQKEKDVLIAKPCTEATSKIKKYLDN